MSACKVPGYGMNDPQTVGSGDFFATTSRPAWAHPAFYPVGVGGFFWIKAAGA